MQRRRVTRFLAIVSAFVLLSCNGGDSNGPEPTVRVANVVVTIGRTAFRVGESVQAAAIAVDSVGGALSGRDISWTSLNPEVAIVSSGGLVTGVGPGTAIIAAESEGKTGQVALQLTLVPVSTVTIAPETQTISAGAKLVLAAILKDSANRVLTGRSIAWTSAAPSIASVSSDGVVSGLLVGTANITATSEGKQGGTMISVNTLNTPVATVTLDPSAANMSGGASKTITATLRDANGNVLGGRTISWTSSNQSVASVSSDGIVTSSPVDGATTITATVEGKSGTASIGVLTFVRMSSGSGFSCGLTSDGTAYCWGANGNGQLGDGTTTSRSLPTRVATDVKFATIASGLAHSCGISLNGPTYCWGQGTMGQIGDGTRSTRLVPTQVSGSFNFVSVAPASRNTCATTNSLDVYCWGVIPSTDAYGSLFPGSKLTPEKIGSDMVAVVAGLDEQYCTVDTNGRAYCWDLEYFYPMSGPVVPPIRGPVSTTLSFSTIRVGNGHACGIAANGQTYCWGKNNAGQLGDGTTTNSTTPVQVAGGKVFSALALGGAYDVSCYEAGTCANPILQAFSCGMTSSGQVYCWGANVPGVGGTTPQLLSGSTLFTGIRAGSNHICGLGTDGAAYCWGNNGAGQLGTGTMVSSSQPTLVFGN